MRRWCRAGSPPSPRRSPRCWALTRTGRTLLHVEEARLTGTVAEPILGRAAKVQALEEITARLGITPAEALAVGDGANDLGMLRPAGAGVALHAKPAVAAQCELRVNHGDLTALLYLQGYSADGVRDAVSGPVLLQGRSVSSGVQNGTGDVKLTSSPVLGWRKAQPFRVQHQAGECRRIRRRIKRVAQDRVARFSHVDP